MVPGEWTRERGGRQSGWSRAGCHWDARQVSGWVGGLECPSLEWTAREKDQAGQGVKGAGGKSHLVFPAQQAGRCQRPAAAGPQPPAGLPRHPPGPRLPPSHTPSQAHLAPTHLPSSPPLPTFTPGTSSGNHRTLVEMSRPLLHISTAFPPRTSPASGRSWDRLGFLWPTPSSPSAADWL